MKVACTVLNGESGSNAADLHNRLDNYGYGRLQGEKFQGDTETVGRLYRIRVRQDDSCLNIET